MPNSISNKITELEKARQSRIAQLQGRTADTENDESAVQQFKAQYPDASPEEIALLKKLLQEAE